MARLSHPGAVQVFDVGVVDADEAMKLGLPAGSPFLAMEMVDGPTLADLRPDIGWKRIRRILLDLLNALAHAHARDVFHLDIKPTNILLRPGAGPVLTDFGIARVRDALDLGETDRVLGTPRYMAPEQFDGSWRDYGPWTDLYAVGCVAWRLVTQSVPFDADDAFDILRKKASEDPPPLPPTTVEVPDGFEHWIHQLLQRDRHNRFVCAADAMWGLKHLDERHTTREFVPSTWESHDPDTFINTAATIVGLREPPLVGREELRDALWSCLNQSQRDGVRFVLLHGAVGSGKTRMANWLCRRAHEVGAAIGLMATHGAVRTPLDGLSGLLAQHFRTTSLDRSATVARIRDELTATAGDDEATLVDAISLGDIALPPGPSDKGRVMTIAETCRVVARYLARLAKQRPVILVLDDMQWGTDSAKLVDTLVSVHADAPILVVGTLRTQAGDDWEDFVDDVVEEIEPLQFAVEPLDEREAARLVRHVVPASSRFASRIANDTGGNPLLVIETVADLIDRGEVIFRETGWELPDDTRPSQTGLADLWRRRAAFVVGTDAENGWTVLEAAAALGPKFDGEQWRAVCAELDVDVPTDLALRMRRYRLVQVDIREDRDVDAYSFAHEVLRQSILEHSDRVGRRIDVERACARVLTSWFGNTNDPAVLERIAGHHERAGDITQALPMLADAALRRHHRDELSHASELLDRHEQLSSSLTPSIAAQDLRRELFRLWIEERSGNPPAISDAQRLHRQAMDLRDPELTAECARFEAKLVRSHSLADAIASLRLTANHLSREDHPLPLARILVTIGWNEGLRGHWETSLGHLRTAIDIFEEHEDHHWASAGHRSLGFMLAQCERYDEAVKHLDEAMRWAREGGDRSELAGGYQHLGEIARYRGDLEDAIANYEKAEELYEGVSSVEWTAARLNRALAEMERGDFDGAERLLDPLDDALERYGETTSLGPYSRLCRAILRGRQGDWGQWFEVETTLFEVERRQWRERDLAWLVDKLGDIAAAAGEREKANVCWGLAEDVWSDIGRDEKARRAHRKLESTRPPIP